MAAILAACSTGHEDDGLVDLNLPGAVVRVPKDWKQAQRKNTTVVQSPSNAAERVEFTVAPVSESGVERNIDSVVDGVKYQAQAYGQPAPSDHKIEVAGLHARLLSWSYSSKNIQLQRRHYILQMPDAFVHISCVNPSGVDLGTCEAMAKSLRPSKG